MTILTTAIKFGTATVFALVLSSTAAISEVKLPKAAKKLNTAEISALYSGKKSTWKSSDNVTGTAQMSADGKIGKGTLVANGNTLNWDSKVVYKKDQYSLLSGC
jgi:Protein of unknown function (DUF995)